MQMDNWGIDIAITSSQKALVMKKGYSDKVKEAVHIFENEKK